MIIPPRLKKGDKVAIVSPSSGLAHLFPWIYKQGINCIRDDWGMIPVEYPTTLESSEYLAQNPKARADDINSAFADPTIKAIIATIGGNDQIRILPYLDKKIIQSNPKIFMGYSDCTNLHLYLFNLGIVSYYGGSIMNQFARCGGMDVYTKDSIKKALYNDSIGAVEASQVWSDADLDWSNPGNLNKQPLKYIGEGWIWHNALDSTINGQLWGGCLEIIDLHLSVKHYLPNFDLIENPVLFLETSEEMPSEGYIYRFFSLLGELGLLQKFKAILMGYPKAQFCDIHPPEGREAYIINQQNAVKSALRDYNANLPVIFNMNFGHTDPQIIIPNSGKITLNGKTRSIVLH